MVRPGFVHSAMTKGMKPVPFATTPDRVAAITAKALQSGRRTVWAPGILRYVFSVLRHVPGPDFPTGGILVEPPDSIAEAYETGRGGFRLRAKWEKEQLKGGGYQIVVTEIPYQVQKSRLIERVAELLAEKKLALLADIRDESTELVRLVLEPKSRTIEPELLMDSKRAGSGPR